MHLSIPLCLSVVGMVVVGIKSKKNEFSRKNKNYKGIDFKLKLMIGCVIKKKKKIICLNYYSSKLKYFFVLNTNVFVYFPVILKQ